MKRTEYIIYNEDGKIKAINRGIVDYSGADASAVIQNTINTAYDNGGGTIFIKAGTYTINKKISLKGGTAAGSGAIELIGEGPATVLQAKGGLNDDIIESYSGGYINDYRTYYRRSRIANMRIDGNKANNTSGNGIVLAWTMEYIIENINFTNVKDFALKLLRSYWTTFRNISVFFSGNGIKIGEYTTGKYNNNDAGNLYSNMTNLTAINIHGDGVPNAIGIHIESGQSNTLYTCDTSGCATGILIKPSVLGGSCRTTTMINPWFEANKIGIAIKTNTPNWEIYDIIIISPTFAGNATDIDNDGIGRTKILDYSKRYLTITTADSPYTASIIYDDTIFCDATNGPITINLPTALGYAGKEFKITKIDSTINAITINPLSGQTINTSISKNFSTRWQTVLLKSDRTSDWKANTLNAF